MLIKTKIMKKILSIAILFLTLTGYSQKMSEQFKVKDYADKQTEMIQSALDLDQATADKVYKQNLYKAYAIKKRIILAESQGQTAGKTLEQVIKEVEKEAEISSGYQRAMLGILGEERYEQFKAKFGQ